MTLCTCAGRSEPGHFEHVQRQVFASRGPYTVFAVLAQTSSDARQVCRPHGEVPTYEVNGDVQVCVWTIPMCRGPDVVCRNDERFYICCKCKRLLQTSYVILGTQTS